MENRKITDVLLMIVKIRRRSRESRRGFEGRRD